MPEEAHTHGYASMTASRWMPRIGVFPSMRRAHTKVRTSLSKTVRIVPGIIAVGHSMAVSTIDCALE